MLRRILISESSRSVHASQTNETSGQRPAAMAFILITLFIDVLGIGIVIPWIKKHKEQFNFINGPLKKHFSIDSSAFAYMGLFEGHN